MADFDAATNKAANTTAVFGASLKSAAANMGIMLAVSVAIKLASAAWDRFNTTVAEARQNLEETQSKISGLKSQIAQLEAVGPDSLTPGQQDKLANLKEQLAVQQELEAIEKRRVARELIGNGNFADYFDKDSYKYRASKIFGNMVDNETLLSDSAYAYVHSQAKVDKIQGELDSMADLGPAYDIARSKLEEELSQAMHKNEKNLENLEYVRSNYVSDRAETLALKAEIQSYIDDGTLVGSDLTKAQEDIQTLDGYLDTINTRIGTINGYLKNGTNESWKKELIHKSNYSIQNLQTEFTDEELKVLATLEFDRDASFNELHTILDEAQQKAGSSRIKITSLTDALNYQETDGEGNPADESLNSKINAYRQDRETLESYSKKIDDGTFSSSDSLDLAQSYGIVGTSLEDTKKKIEELQRLNLSSILGDINDVIDIAANEGTKAKLRAVADELQNLDRGSFTIPMDTSSAVEKLSELETRLSGLNNAAASLADGDTVGLSALNEIQSAFSELEDADTSAVNAALEELADASSLEEAQPALNALAEEYLNCSGILKGLTEDNANLVATRLEAIGVTDAQSIVEANLNAERLKEQLYTLGNSSAIYNRISSLVSEGEVSGYTASALFNLISAEQIFANQTLSTQGKVRELERLALAFGIVSDSGSLAAEISAKINLMTRAGKDPEYINNEIANMTNAYTAEIQEKIKSKFGSIDIDYSKNTDSSSVSPAPAASTPAPAAAQSPAAEAAETADTFYSLFDWMERRLSRLELIAAKAVGRVKDSLAYAMDTGYVSKTFGTLNDQMKQNAYMAERYRQSAKDSGLSQDWIDKIEGGAEIDYDHIRDEALAGKIKEYEDWYKKSLDCAEANEKLKDSVKELSEAIAQAPIDKAAEKADKYDSAVSLADAKIKNKKTASGKNTQLDKKSGYIGQTLSAYQAAKDTAEANVKTYKKKVTGQKPAAGASKKQKERYETLMEKVKAAASAKKKISDKTLEGIYAYCSSIGDFTWYQNAVAYNAAREAKDSAKETYGLYKQTAETEKREIAKEKFDNIVTEYDNKISLADNSIKTIDNQISLAAARGQAADAAYYEIEKVFTAEKLAMYREELTKLQQQLDTLEWGSQEWYDAKGQLQECTDAIYECEEGICEYNNSIQELNIEKLEKAADSLNRIRTEQEFLAGLMSHEKQFDENGSFTEYGLATLGTYASAYSASKNKAANDETEINRLKGMLASGDLGEFNSREQLQARIDELYTAWQNDISETYEAQESVFELMSDKFDAELDALQEVIDARKEALDIEKELYDYQNEIAEKTENITTLQKQLAAYGGDTSEEGRARIQKLESSLREARKDLKETEYEKYISDQKDMLDELYTEYKETVQNQLENFKETVRSGFDLANANMDAIRQTLLETAKANGYDIQNSGTADAAPTGTDTSNASASDISRKAGLTQPNIQNGLFHEESDALAAAKKEKSDKKSLARDFILSHLKKAEKKKNTYSDINQVFYGTHSGQIIPAEQLKDLAGLLGVSYNGCSKSGNLYAELKRLGIKGFSKGGIARALQGRLQRNGDSLLASVNPNETILTQKFTDLLPDAARIMDDFIHIDIPSLPDISLPASGNSIGDVAFHFEVSGCETPFDLVKEIQRNPNAQRALQSVTIDRIAGKPRMNINTIK